MDKIVNPSLIGFSDLKELTGYDRQADVEKCLRRQGIAFFRGRNGIFTTLDLVNAAGGLVAYGSEADSKEAAQRRLLDLI